ncbi:MAG TPA: DinB family protein [Thermoanaerobaculia bacterium]|nr:DinB family protein [Thermoanaerobaculia bacterium]
MNRPLSLIVALVLTVSAFAADNDKAALVAQLQRTEARFLKSIDGLSEAQWNFKPAPDRWSIAECAEHVTAAEPLIRGMIAEAIKNKLTAEMLPAAKKDEQLLTGLVDRSKKFKAPEPLIPTNRFGNPQAAVEKFKSERAETIKLASTPDLDLRAQGGPHPFLGPLDAYGWFLFQSGHSERHTLQIEEVKADPNFPKQ